jgi:antitoxin HicB
MKNLEYYLELPYTVILRRDEDKDWVARVDELPGCAAHGKTTQEALKNLEEAKQLWIADCLERNDLVPEPPNENALPSGKWVQRVARSLHGKLVALAKREKVSLNQLVTSMLAEAVGARKTDERHIGVPVRDFAEHWTSGIMGPLEVKELTRGWKVIDVPSSSGMLTSTLKIMGRQIPNRGKLDLKEFTYGYKQAAAHKHK